MILFRCPACGQEMQVTDDFAGRQGRCPKCQAVVTIPPASAMSPAVPPMGAVPRPSDTKQARASLILGIVGFFLPLLGFILGILAIVFGALGLRRQAGKGMAIAGLIPGIADLVVAPTLMAALLIPVLGHARELARQAACMANLKAVGSSIALYSAAANDQYPFPLIRQYGDPNSPVGPANVSDKSPFDPAIADSANGMQNVWLLVEQNLVGSSAFHCPSDGGWRMRPNPEKYGWTSSSQFSYGVHWPYDGPDGGAGEKEKQPAPLSDPNLAPSLVIMADRNPGGAVGVLNPSNHTRDGESFLRKDSSVVFYKNAADSKAGHKGDDVYTSADGQAGGVPQNPYDTSIAPGAARP